MPSVNVLKALLTSFDLDAETSEYLATALEDAEPEERKELIEPFLDESQVQAILKSFADEVSKEDAKPKFSPPKREVLGANLAELSGSFAPAEEIERQEEGCEEGKIKAVKKEKAPPKSKASNSFSELPTVEVTCKVSRFHKDSFDHKFIGISIEGVCVSVNRRQLIADADLNFSAGDRYGLLGQNGSGKSTLLRAMANGSIPAWPRNCRTLLVDQDDVGDERSALEVVMAASTEIASLRRKEALLSKASNEDPCAAKRALLEVEEREAAEAYRLASLYAAKLSCLRGKAAGAEELKARQAHWDAKAALDECKGGDETHVHKLSELLSSVREELELLDADSLEGKARKMMRGLGFTEELMNKRTELLSGGWRMRTALASALVAEPDVLLLDEPTNHLDWPALLWFESYLKTLDNIVLIMVSHDRTFLDEVATNVVRLCNGNLQYFKGNYSAFEEALEKEKIDKANYKERIQDKVDKEWEKVRKMEIEGRRSNNTTLLNQVASRKKKLGVGTSHGICRVGVEKDVNGKAFKIFSSAFDSTDQGASQVTDDAQAKMTLTVAGNLGFEGDLLQCRQLQFGYDKAIPFSQAFDLDVRLTSRIAFLGMNGCGKTTLVRTMAQELAPLKGEVYIYPRLVVAYFSQHVADSLPLDKTPFDSMKELYPEATENQIRAQLGSFGIRTQAVVPLGCLSGGEKARVSLASIMFKPPHVLLLDEPTNHLDLNTVEALAAALKSFEGGIVLVSHDRRLIEALDCLCYVLGNGKLAKSSLQDFLRSVRRKHATT